MVFFTYSNKDTQKVNFIYELIKLFYQRKRKRMGKIFYAQKMKNLPENFDFKSAISRSKTIIYFLSENSSFDLPYGYIVKEREYIAEALSSDPDKNLILVTIGQGGKVTKDFKIYDHIDLTDLAEGHVDPFKSKPFKTLLAYIDKPRFKYELWEKMT